MPSDMHHKKIACLKAMRRQLSDLMETLEVQPPSMSLQTWNKTRMDMDFQHASLEFAIEELVRAYGEPPQIIEGTATRQ